MAFYAKEGVHPRVIKRLRKGVRGKGALSQKRTKQLIKGMTLVGYTQFGVTSVVAYCSHQKQQGYPVSVSKGARKVIS